MYSCRAVSYGVAVHGVFAGVAADDADDDRAGGSARGFGRRFGGFAAGASVAAAAGASAAGAGVQPAKAIAVIMIAITRQNSFFIFCISSYFSRCFLGEVPRYQKRRFRFLNGTAAIFRFGLCLFRPCPCSYQNSNANQ